MAFIWILVGVSYPAALMALSMGSDRPVVANVINSFLEKYGQAGYGLSSGLAKQFLQHVSMPLSYLFGQTMELIRGPLTGKGIYLPVINTVLLITLGFQ